MPRDELRQPLRKRSLKERLWARRPSAFALTAGSLAALFVVGGIWISRIPYPFAGEPVVVAVIPPPQELQTSSTTLPGDGTKKLAPSRSGCNAVSGTENSRAHASAMMARVPNSRFTY